eukprot:jgi/Botrbrau1/12293/Bobra.27_5s0004.1
MDSVEPFYDDLAEDYHLIFKDWNASIQNQAEQIDGLIRESLGLRSSVGMRVLDAACGIGTQALGLAAKGYCLTGIDISSKAVARASAEATTRGLSHMCRFRVADMRTVSSAAQDMRYFDVVIALDNALPHLLSDSEITQALREFHRCLRPRGLCVVSARDYDAVQRAPGAVQLLPYGIRQRALADGTPQKVIAMQTWEWDRDARTYELSMYLVFDSGNAQPETRVSRTRYYAVALHTLEICMQAAGFERVRVERNAFFQPVVLGYARDPVISGNVPTA